MLSSVASILFLGILAPPPARPVPSAPPGITALVIAPPSSLKRPIEPPALSASGMLLIDVESGQELLSIAPHVQRPIASLTKIMTALIVLEERDTDETLTVPPIVENVGGSRVELIVGEHFSVLSLLKALLIPSANDAAYALAAAHHRGVGGFVKAMNDRARTLGLLNTHFTNPAGLDHPEQYSTPRDMAWLTMAALKHPTFASIVSTRHTSIVSLEGSVHPLRNTNELLHYNEDVFGVKTGTTENAGECLIVLFTEGTRRYLLVLLGSKNRYTDSLSVLSSVHDAS